MNIPYQAYKSKRHSRTLSNNKLILSPSPSPPRPSSVHDSLPVQVQPQHPRYPSEEAQGNVSDDLHTIRLPSVSSPSTLVPISTSSDLAHEASSQETASRPPPQPLTVTASPPASSVAISNTKPTMSSSSTSPTTSMTTRRNSTFRRIPSRAALAPVIPSPLNPGNNSRTASLPLRHLDPNSGLTSHRRLSTVTLLSTSPQAEPSQDVPVGRAAVSTQTQSDASQSDRRATTGTVVDNLPPAGVLVPAQRTPSSSPSHTPATSSPITSPSPSSTATATPVRFPAPYRPGFQPKGVYRALTDEFLERRRFRRDIGRIEKTRLDRRLEKLTNLHFGESADKIATAQPKQMKRMPSIWELNIRNMGPSDLWRGVIQSQVTPGSRADVRAAEQNITPWQSDADVSQCPLCAASFHPITNRKHHCRLCGNIICSLPVKHPQRPVTCSLLFVVDPKTGQIEEVGEGVDYGVRRRTLSSAGYDANRNGTNPDEKFLRGVRICLDCRPVLLRKQYAQDRIRSPMFSKLYDVFINLEKEIEDALPQFQELLLTLTSDDNRPTLEASAARKRLLDAFSQYDALAKRIRGLPTSGPGSSQDRVLAAVLARANNFLQKHMFPLQSLPKLSKSTSSQATPADDPAVDPHSELAHALQPLLEQEALLESFVEEAKAHRKFEDAKILKNNLHEIRAEIDKLVGGTHKGGRKSSPADGQSKKLTN